MLAILTHSNYDEGIKARLSAMALSTPVILCGDGVYLYFQLSAELPELAIYVLAEDAFMRGWSLPSERLLDYQQWVMMSQKFNPWVMM